MTKLKLIHSPGRRGIDPQWTHKLDEKHEITIQDASAYAGGYAINIWAKEEVTMYHFGEECSFAAAWETAAHVLALVEKNCGDIETAHAEFHGN